MPVRKSVSGLGSRPAACVSAHGPALWLRGALAIALLAPLGGAALSGGESGSESPDLEIARTNPDLVAFQDLPVVIETVCGASKREQKVTEAPSSVSIVTRDDIAKFGYRTLTEILNGVRGIYVTTDRAYDHIGIRGLNRPGDYGGRVLVNVNGHRINDPVYDSALCGYEFPLDVDLIERVEVIRGPGSALYGNNAFAGIVNVVTRQGRDIGGKGLEVSGSYGAYDAYSGRLSYGNTFKNGVETLVSGTWYDSQGEPRLHFPEYDYIGGVVKNFDNERQRNVFASVSFAGFTLEGLYNRRDKEVPTAGYYTIFNDKRLRLYDERAYAELRYRNDFAGGWTMNARAYYDRYAYQGTYPYELDAGVVALNKDKPLAQMAGGEFQVGSTLGRVHRVTLGVEGRYDFEVRQLNYDVVPRETYLDTTLQPYSFGLYAQDEYAILDNLTLNVGFRYDHFSLFGDTLNPRAAIIFHPRKSSTFKALYGQAYRTPNAYEVEYQDALYAANTDVEPETVRSYELVWEEFVGSRFQVTGCLFYNEIASFIQQEEVTQNGDTYTTFNNSAAATVLGGEAELGIRWGQGLRGSLSYCFAETLATDVGNRLTNAPRHVGKAHLVVPIFREKVFAGLELQAMSNRKTVQDGKVPAHAIVNLNFFGRELVKGLEFSAGLYNVFDTKYDDPAGPDFLQDRIPQRERTFRVKLTCRW